MVDILKLIHFLASILFIGPVTVVASIFPRFFSKDNPPKLLEGNATMAGTFNGITKIYGYLSVLVPISGIVLGAHFHILDKSWIYISIILTVIAALILLLLIIPTQNKLIAGKASLSQLKQLNMFSGIFSLLWVVTLFFMVYK